MTDRQGTASVGLVGIAFFICGAGVIWGFAGFVMSLGFFLMIGAMIDIAVDDIRKSK